MDNDYDLAREYLSTKRMVSSIPQKTINELNYLASIFQDNTTLMQNSKVPFQQIIEFKAKYGGYSAETARKRFVEVLNKAAPSWKALIIPDKKKGDHNDTFKLLEASDSVQNSRSISSESNRKKLWRSIKERVGDVNELPAAKFKTPIRKSSRQGFRTERSGLTLPRISRGKDVEATPLEKQDYKIVQLVSNLEESIKEQFSLHNAKFDAGSEIIVAKSLSDFNVALLGEYFLPKLKIVKYGLKSYLEQKKPTSAKEATFLKNTFTLYDNVINCYVEMAQKLKVELERKKHKESQLSTHINDALNGIESICELKDMKNSEVGLYGISKRTEQEYIQALNQARQNLFACTEDYSRRLDKMLDDLQKYIEEKNTHILYYRNNVKLLEAQMMEKDKAQAAFMVKSNSDKTELAGVLHQIKKQLVEKGLVSGEELDQYKEKIVYLTSEVERLKRELAKKTEAELSPRNSQRMAKIEKRPMVTLKKEQGTQCVDRGASEKSSRDAKTFKFTTGLAAIYDDFALGYIEPLEWTMQIVDLVYLDKYFADIDDLKEGRVVKPLKEYLPEWFLTKFGIRKYAEVMLKDFLKSLTEYGKDYDRFKLFAQFLGISVSGKACELDRVDLRKAFFLSPDVNFAFVKFVYRLRSGCSPYLPILHVNNASTLKLLEELGNFVNVDKGKKAFVAFMKEYGYKEDRYTEFNDMLKYLAEQEQKHVERYTALKESGDLKKAISFDGYVNACINQYVNVRIKDTETLKASFQILESGTECNLRSRYNEIDTIHYEEYVNAVKRAQPRRTDRWIDQTYHQVKESRGYEVLSAADAVSRILPWLGDSYSLTSYKMDNPDTIENELQTKKSEKKMVTIKPMRDPLTNVFMLEQTCKIMKQVLGAIEGQKNELSKALLQVKGEMANVIEQFASGEFNYGASMDPTGELWKKFRRILEILVKR